MHEWLADNGVATSKLKYSPAKDWITVTLPVEQIEGMLDTKYAVYRHEDESELVRAPEWSLPAHLHDHIDTVQPTNSWFRSKPQSVGVEVKSFLGDDATVSDVCNATAVTPACIRTLYGTIDYVPQAADVNTMGLCNYLNETSNRNDTYTFLEAYRPDAADGANTFKFVSIANGTTDQFYTAAAVDQGTGIEGNLDVQNMLSVGYPTPLTVYTTGGSPDFIPDGFTPTNVRTLGSLSITS